MFSLSTFVIGPAITGSGSITPNRSSPVATWVMTTSGMRATLDPEEAAS
jgi:hypothetical protein